MFKIIASAVMAGSFTFTACQDASACGGGLCRSKTTCAPAPAAVCDAQPASAPAAPSAMPDMPDMPPAPATAQNSRNTFRSYSYDPAPVYRAPLTPSYGRQNWQQYQFRADRKMRGL